MKYLTQTRFSRSIYSFFVVGVMTASCGPQAPRTAAQNSGVLNNNQTQFQNTASAPSQQIGGNYQSSLRVSLMQSGGQPANIDTRVSLYVTGGTNAASIPFNLSADQSLPGLQINSVLSYVGDRAVSASGDRYYSMLSQPITHLKSIFTGSGSLVDHPFLQTVCLRIEYYFVAQQAQYTQTQHPQTQYNQPTPPSYNSQVNQPHGNQVQAQAQPTYTLDVSRSTAYFVRCLAGGRNDGLTPEKGSLLGTRDGAYFSPLTRY